MNGEMYADWAKHYDPQKKELQILENHGIYFNDKKVLEVGAGTGRFTQRILPFCKEIVCIDPDDNALSILKTNIIDKRVTVFCGTLDTVPVKPAYFDYVVFPWSMYLVTDKEKNLKISYNSLVLGGRAIILQANTGEYENEIAQLYSDYNSMDAYGIACDILPGIIKKVFGNITCDTLQTFFSFESINQVIETSLFFIEDEEGHPPSENAIRLLKDRLSSYVTPNGNLIMSDVVSIFLATKE